MDHEKSKADVGNKYTAIEDNVKVQYEAALQKREEDYQQYSTINLEELASSPAWSQTSKLNEAAKVLRAMDPYKDSMEVAHRYEARVQQIIYEVEAEEERKREAIEAEAERLRQLEAAEREKAEMLRLKRIQARKEKAKRVSIIIGIALMVLVVGALILDMVSTTTAERESNLRASASSSDDYLYWISDNAKLLSAETKEALASKNMKLDDTYGSLVAIKTVSGLNGRDIQSYAEETAQEILGKRDMLLFLDTSSESWYVVFSDYMATYVETNAALPNLFPKHLNDDFWKEGSANMVLPNLFDDLEDWYKENVPPTPGKTATSKEEVEASPDVEQKYQDAVKLEESGDIAAAAMAFGSLGAYEDARQRSFALWDTIADRRTVDAGLEHTVALKEDGTVVATGNSADGRCDVSGWTDIIAVSAGAGHTVGLKADGTVVATGFNANKECDVSGWTDIVAISAGTYFTAGLKADGTLVATGHISNSEYLSETNVIAISAGVKMLHILKADGTVKTPLQKQSNKAEIYYTSICADSDTNADLEYMAALSESGKVCQFVESGYTMDGSESPSWTGVTDISCMADAILACKSDGTAVTDCPDFTYSIGIKTVTADLRVSHWADIVSVAAGGLHYVGLKSDGTLVTVGENEMGECDVSGWTNIKLPS